MTDKTQPARQADPGLNKTLITSLYFGLAGIAIICVALISVIRPDATPALITFIGTVMGIASTGAVTFYLLGKQNEKLEVVQKQTNGNLSRLTDENARLTAQLLALVGNSPSENPPGDHAAR